MKSCFLVFIFLLLCIFIEGTKHEKQREKYPKTQNETVKKNVSKIASTNKSKGPAIGLFSLKASKKTKHLKTKKTSKQNTKKSKSKVSKLLKEFKRCMRVYGAKYCKKRKNFKKAMIWPKKMLPALEKMLLNRLNGGSDNANGYDNYDNPTNPTPSSVDSNDYADNWDNIKPSHHHRSHHSMFNGMEVVPLLKMLKERVGDSSPYDSNGFTGTPSTQGGSKFLTKLLLNQALGKPDRGSVMKDMMQEFYLANGNDRSGEEAREAFNELIGHNNLIKANSDMEAANTDVNMGQSPGGSDNQIGRMSMPDRDQSFSSQQGGGGDIQGFQGFGGGGGGEGGIGRGGEGGIGRGGEGGGGGEGGVVQAQELPNGKIAPVNQPIMGSNIQRMMPMNVNPTTRMLGNEKISDEISRNQVMENQMPTSVAAMHDSESRPIGFARNNDLVFEEEGENAARGIKPPPFARANPYYAENVMNLGPNYQSNAITEPAAGAARGSLQMQGNRYAAAFGPAYPSTSEEILASRRNDLPVNHKQHKSSKKTPMRSKDLPTRPHDKGLKKAKHSTKTT